MSPESVKTQLRRIQPSLVMSSADNGIEKVRGSTPLISTIHESASGPRGLVRFLFSRTPPAKIWYNFPYEHGRSS